MKVFLHLVEHVEKRVDTEAGQEERYPEPKRITRQQADPFVDGVLLAGDNEDGRQDRADAGSPTEREGGSYQERSELAEFPLPDMKPLFIVQEIYSEQPHHLQSEDDEQHAGNPADRGVVLIEGFPEGCRRSAEENKNEREAGNEEE